MLKFLRKIIKALSPDRSVPPKPVIPTRFAELFAKDDVWLVAFEPDKAKIPDGCNFILWFESDHSQEELLQVFEFEKWQAQVGNSGFTLTQIIPIRHMRSGRIEEYQINIAAMVTARVSNLFVLAGNCTYPRSIGAQFRGLILRLEGQSNNLFCLYFDGGALWREIPATAELLGLDPSLLSDADWTAIGTGFVKQPLTGSWESNGNTWCLGNRKQQRVSFLFDSVVADGKDITSYSYEIKRLSWNDVLEVELESPDCQFSWHQRIVNVKGEAVTLFINPNSIGFSTFEDRLAELPGFSIEEFRRNLNGDFGPGDVCLVWRRFKPPTS